MTAPARPAGRLVRCPEGYSAFVPDPLPPTLTWSPRLVGALSAADRAVGRLAGEGGRLPNPHLLIRPFLRREAVLSSRIEGTQATLGELLQAEAGAAVARNPADLREVANYVAALEHGIDRLRTLPLSLRLVRELHAHLMEGVRGDYATPGEFRRTQNWIGPPGCTLADATYVPPPPGELLGALGAWETFLHDTSLPPLAQIALAHHQFEAIHPFVDGNGRVGRLLITLFLVERERLSQPLLYLSDFIEARRQEYYERLQRVRTHGDWPGWLRYFLEGVTSTARKALRQAAQLMDLRDDLHRRLRDRPRALGLVDELFVNPYLSVTRAERILGVSNPTARQAVKQLEKAGVLEEITGRAWGRLYGARPILRAIEGRSRGT